MNVEPTKIAFLTLLFAGIQFGGAIAKERPNILLILADDVGREVLQCYGGSSYKTPNLDQLAADGAKFQHCYSMPVCHPTRVTLLTGQYPRHLGNPRWGSFPKKAEDQTFASIARRAGYATAVVGKWQLCLLKDDLFHPRRLGFDHWSLFGWHEGPRYHAPLLYTNGARARALSSRYGPDLYLEFLIDFMERNGDREQPFLAFYSMALCHDVTNDLKTPVPYGPRGRYESFSEMVARMDQQIGELRNFLRSSGLDESTLILFTSDNGTAGRSKLSAINNTTEFVYENVISDYRGRSVPGGKGKLTDWGTRVPTIAVWKGVIEPGQTWNDLVDFSDFLPTISALTHGDLPASVRLDGHSFSGLLTGDGSSARKWAYAEHRGKFFVKTHERKLYSNGKLFNTELDPFEEKSLDTSKLSGKAKQEWRLLKRVMANLKQARFADPVPSPAPSF